MPREDKAAGNGESGEVQAPKRGQLTLAVTDVVNTDVRKEATVTVAFRYAIFKSGDKWIGPGLTVVGDETAKAVGVMTGQDDWRDAYAYGVRSVGQAIGNRTANVIEPPVAGERAQNLSQLRQDAEKAVQAILAVMPQAVRDGLDEAAVAAMVEANYAGLIAAKTERRTAREAADQKAANGGLPPRGAPGALTGLSAGNGGTIAASQP